MTGRDIKADAVRAGLPLYQVAAEAGINPSQLSRLLNGREPLRDGDEQRIRGAIRRLSSRQTATPVPVGRNLTQKPSL